MSIILPSRLAWALGDQPARSKGLWYGIAGAFVAGVLVASFVGNLPRIEPETPSVVAEKAPVVAKVAPPPATTIDPASTAASPQKVASKTARNNVASKAPPGTGAAKPVAPQALPEDPPRDETVRIGFDRIIPSSGLGDALASANPPSDEIAPIVAATETPAPGSAGPERTATLPSPMPDTAARPDAPASSREMAAVRPVPMPREKPATGRSDAVTPSLEDAPPVATRVDSVAEVLVELDPPAPSFVSVPAIALAPMPRAKPVTETQSIATSIPQPSDAEREAAIADLAEDRPIGARTERRNAFRRAAIVQETRAASIDRREMRRAERAEARAAAVRSREMRSRNEAEGFELVRSYRGRDGRRISVYQRVERRVAYRTRPLFGRPAFLLPRGGLWR